MYVIWSRGNEPLDFPIDTQDNVISRRKRETHSHITTHSQAIPETNLDHGTVMVQLLRADKLEIPER